MGDMFHQRVFYDVCNVRLDTAEEKMAGFLDQNEKLKGKNVQISEFTTACSALFWCQNWWSICFFWRGGGAGGSVWRINSLQRVVQHNRRQHCSVLSSIDERKISPMMPQRSSCIPSAGGLSVDPIESLIFFSLRNNGVVERKIYLTFDYTVTSSTMQHGLYTVAWWWKCNSWQSSPRTTWMSYTSNCSQFTCLVEVRGQSDSAQVRKCQALNNWIPWNKLQQSSWGCGAWHFLETLDVLNHWQMLNNVHSERMKLRLQQVMAVAISDSSLVERPWR